METFTNPHNFPNKISEESSLKNRFQFSPHYESTDTLLYQSYALKGYVTPALKIFSKSKGTQLFGKFVGFFLTF